MPVLYRHTVCPILSQMIVHVFQSKKCFEVRQGNLDTIHTSQQTQSFNVVYI